MGRYGDGIVDGTEAANYNGSYVYLSVKLYLENGQTEDSINEIVQDLDYYFSHDQITDYEIVDIVDIHLSTSREIDYVDPYDVQAGEQ